MDMMLKIASVVIISVVSAQVVKKGASEQAVLLSIATAVAILWFLSGTVLEVVNMLQYLSEIAQIDSVLLSPVLKTVAISITSKVTSELCQQCGENGLASFVELSGTVLSLAVALPLLKAVMEMMVVLL